MTGHGRIVGKGKKRPLALGALIGIALVLLLALPACGASPGALATPPAIHGASPLSAQVKTWEFERFDTDIKVNTDGSLTVRETQVANFTGQFHFLNRDLTTATASFSGGRTYGKVRYKDIKVFYPDGRPYPTAKVQNIKGGKRVRIEFSAENEQRGWIVQYRMTGALIYAPAYNRVYFNAVSSDRDVPIKSSRSTVTLPAGVDMRQVQTKDYPDTSHPPGEVTSGSAGRSVFWLVKDIAPFSTFTVDVAFPRGLVSVPVPWRGWFAALMIVLAALIALGASAWILVLWWRKGRDVGAPSLDVVQYEAPAGLRPAEVGVLVSQAPETSDITATIVDLAVRGKLIIREEQEGAVFKHKSFGFERKDVAGLAPFEQKVMDALFESGDSVSEDDLHNQFYTHISGIDSELKQQVLAKGFFDGDPGRVKRKYFRFGLLCLLLIVPVFLLWSAYDLGWFIALAPGLAVAGLMVIIVGLFMPRRTQAGSAAYSAAMGFKEYMATAEREEMKLMTAENFQANLPYAMVLGVASEWAGKFQEIYTTPPGWYRGYTPGTAFTSMYLADSLMQMQTSVGSTLTSSPSSSSGGGGGGFGGGSSGGGFGGGGSSAG